jgi:hypothetical protein
MAALLPGVRYVHTYDFENAFTHAPYDPQKSETLSPDLSAWAYRSWKTRLYEVLDRLRRTPHADGTEYMLGDRVRGAHEGCLR